MNKTDRKNNKRRLEAMNVRQNRVVVGYVQYLHPEIYKKAEEFYENLNARYPNKKDLRKTNDYEWLKSNLPASNQVKYYDRKGKNNTEPTKTVDNTEPTKTVDNTEPTKTVDNTEPTKIVDNMELVIPLMSLAEKEAVDLSAHSEIEMAVEQQVEVITESNPTVFSELNISDETISEMIHELRQDPDLDMVFNDFDTDCDIDFDDFDGFDEETPLERELNNIF